MGTARNAGRSKIASPRSPPTRKKFPSLFRGAWAVEDSITVEILPEDYVVDSVVGVPLADLLAGLAIPINYPCGGKGTCGRCRVRFRRGAPFPAQAEHRRLLTEELDGGERLACQCNLRYDSTVEIPGHTRLVEPRILISSGDENIPLSPWVIKAGIELEPHSVEDPVSDVERALRVLRESPGREPVFELAALRKLPAAMARGAATITLCDGVAIDAEAGETRECLYGVAIDIGTTTVAAGLHSLRTGKAIGTTGRMNPQVEFGEDVVTRLTFVHGAPDRLEKMRARIVACINELVQRLCWQAALETDWVYAYAIAGNAAMNHLFLGVPPDQIAIAPYTPAFRGTPLFAARELGLVGNAGARVSVLPNIGGFVGGDTVAGLMACDFLKKENETALFLDIGTNCEVVLKTRDRMLAASAPAGPALEGACISCGRRAEPGAICDARIEGDRLVLDTLDDLAPTGLCGSGLVHIVQALREAGIVNASGVYTDLESIIDPALRALAERRLGRDGEGRPRFRLSPDGEEEKFYLTQRDIREFQLAKGAIAATWQVLCQIAGTAADSIERVYIAGAFGNYIRADAAILLGMVPPLDRDAVRSVGNTSLDGARLVLLNDGHRREAAQLLDRCEFVELAGRDDFEETFALEMSL